MADHPIYNNLEEFKLFYLETFPSISIFAQRYVKDNAIAKDIAQEAFVSIWEKRPSINTLKEIRYYLYHITKNKCLNYLKKNKLQENYLLHEAAYSSDEFFESKIIEQEFFIELHKAIGSLGTQTQTIIQLALRGYGNMEISEHIGISTNTIKTLKKRAFNKLNEKLKKHFYTFFF